MSKLVEVDGPLTMPCDKCGHDVIWDAKAKAGSITVTLTCRECGTVMRGIR